MTHARTVEGGTCHVFVAFEAAVAIDLDAAERRVRGAGREDADAAPAPVCYSPADACPHDALAVPEFANVELVEMRWLDDRLDRALDAAHRAAADSLRGPRILAVQTGGQARRIAELQLDAAGLFESVNNALKLFGDRWLARLHGAATRRMHIDDFERSVLRKLQALDSTYGKVRDRQVQVRAEILEWIIIVLIAAEILLFLK